MGYVCYHQDDTGLEEQAAFRYTDGKGLSVALAFIEVVPSLEQQLQLDLTPLRQVAVDWEAHLAWGERDWASLLTPDVAGDASLQAQLTTLCAEMDAAWQSVAALREGMTGLLTTVGWPAQSFPPELAAAIPSQPTQRAFVEGYLGEGIFAKDLVDVLKMLRWAELRGATRVRLLVR